MSPADRRCSANTIEPATTSSLALFLLLLQRDQSSRTRGLPWGLNAYLLKSRSILASPHHHHHLPFHLPFFGSPVAPSRFSRSGSGGWGGGGGILGQGRCFVFCFFNFLGFFVWFLLFLPFQKGINSTSRGRKKNHVIRKQRRVRASHFHVSPFPHRSSPARLPSLPLGFHSLFRFGLFSIILFSPFVLPAWFLIGPTCPLPVRNRYFLDKLFFSDLESWILCFCGGLLTGGTVPISPPPIPVHPSLPALGKLFWPLSVSQPIGNAEFPGGGYQPGEVWFSFWDLGPWSSHFDFFSFFIFLPQCLGGTRGEVRGRS